jgi:hypothetical protein
VSQYAFCNLGPIYSTQHFLTAQKLHRHSFLLNKNYFSSVIKIKAQKFNFSDGTNVKKKCYEQLTTTSSLVAMSSEHGV